MHDTVRIEPGYHIIDAGAWVRQRASEPLADLTAALDEFTRHPVFDEYQPQVDASARMQLWCAARGWTTTACSTMPAPTSRSPTCSAAHPARRTPNAATASPTTTGNATKSARAMTGTPSTARPATSGAGWS